MGEEMFGSMHYNDNQNSQTRKLSKQNIKFEKYQNSKIEHYNDSQTRKYSKKKNKDDK